MFFLNQILRDSHGWVPCGAGADPKTERSLGHSVAGKKQLKSWYLFLVARDKMVVYHLNLDVAGTDILCVFGSLLMVVSQMDDWFGVSVLFPSQMGGAPSLRPIGPPKTSQQPRHRGILQASVASSPCPRTWENNICHEKFKILPSFCEYGWEPIVNRPTRCEELLWFYKWIICPEKSVVWQVCWKEGSKNPFQLFLVFRLNRVLSLCPAIPNVR